MEKGSRVSGLRDSWDMDYGEREQGLMDREKGLGIGKVGTVSPWSRHLDDRAS